MTSTQHKALRTVGQIVLGVLPLCFGVVFFHLYRGNPKAFMALCEEDALVENMQFLFFLAAGVLAVRLAVKFWSATDKLVAVAYGMFGLLCVFIAMEEISWGQRLIGFETPDAIKDDNIQDEFNLHNIGPIQKVLFLFYTLVGMYACASAALWALPGLRRRRWFQFLSVCPCLLLYFLPILTYGIYRLRLGNWRQMRLQFSHEQARMISLVQEPVELGLALGFFLITVVTWIRLRNASPGSPGTACTSGSASARTPDDSV